MLQHTAISLIAVPSTLSAGLESFLCHNAGASVKSVRVASPECDQSDVLITTPAHFIAHLDYFLPRKAKTVLIYNDRNYEIPEQVATIFLNDEPQQTLQRLKAVAHPGAADADDSGLLTSREVEVLKEIASGKINKEIADSLNISVNTVITHRKNISQKLGIRSVSGLSLYALMNGII